jgi:hypothetical protein
MEEKALMIYVKEVPSMVPHIHIHRYTAFKRGDLPGVFYYILAVLRR